MGFNDFQCNILYQNFIKLIYQLFNNLLLNQNNFTMKLKLVLIYIYKFIIT